MPPSHHSSSSHSSSHSSHSHSSSSRSFSSSRSSSSSAFSSRSRASGKHDPFATHSSSTHRTTQRQKPVQRSRVNQPLGISEYHGTRPIVRLCRNHDYTYYDSDWTYEGVHYRKGYYDENGQYYENVAIKENGRYIVDLKCEYCGNQSRYEWKEGELPHCSSCGARMTFSNVTFDEAKDAVSVRSVGTPRRSSSSFLKVFSVLIFSVALLIIGGTFYTIRSAMHVTHLFEETDGNVQEFYETSDDDITSIYGETLYLEKIGENTYRLVKAEDDWEKALDWDADSQNYYDAESDCYIWNNRNVGGVWQYWYEGISSQYPESGWMEYDTDEKRWYVENQSNNWIVYEEDSSQLWHIEE